MEPVDGLAGEFGESEVYGLYASLPAHEADLTNRYGKRRCADIIEVLAGAGLVYASSFTWRRRAFSVAPAGITQELSIQICAKVSGVIEYFVQAVGYEATAVVAHAAAHMLERLQRIHLAELQESEGKAKAWAKALSAIEDGTAGLEKMMGEM